MDGRDASDEKGDTMGSIAVRPHDASVAADQQTETEWPSEIDRSREPLSPGVTALIGIAALALSAVCTTLLLTFASTSIGTSLIDDGTSGSSVVHTVDD
ncbi:hypothetical protein [Labedella endophytica]|uniref:Uncharacterized protein n=1 Tax=Labedella endophytica TaxID=1523160 RepID=A0A3S1CU57_9MICO|nr:hypothetical protein [Labedella endophytica]RUR03187.1 hypothetical protein ELQ94_01125 [Labedella endophytica]